MTMTSNLKRTLAAAALLLSACGAKERPAFSRRADQVDRARWEQVCGAFQDEKRYDETPPAIIVTTFSRFSLDPQPHMPPTFVCKVSRFENDQRIERLTLRVYASTARELRDLYGPVRDLLWDLVPDAMWPTVRIVAEAPESVVFRSHGFWIEGGFHAVGGQRTAWELEVRTSEL